MTKAAYNATTDTLKQKAYDQLAAYEATLTEIYQLSISLARDGFDPELEVIVVAQQPGQVEPDKRIPAPSYSPATGLLSVTDFGDSTHFDVEIDLPDGAAAAQSRHVIDAIYPLLLLYPRAIGYRVSGSFSDPNGSPDWVTEWSQTQALPVLVKVVNGGELPVWIASPNPEDVPVLVAGQDMAVGNYIASDNDGTVSHPINLSRVGTAAPDHAVKITLKTLLLPGESPFIVAPVVA